MGSAAGRKTSARYEARRSAIMAAAVATLNRRGVHGMTLGEVAGRVGLAPTATIYYFPSKEALAEACLLRAVQVFDGFLAAGEGEGDVAARVARVLEACLEFRRDSGEEIALFNDVRVLNSDRVNAAYEALFRRARALLGGRGGVADNGRTHLLLAELFWTVTWLRRLEPDDYARAARRMGAILAHGIAAPGSAWPARTLPPLAEPDVTPADQFLTAATAVINEEGYGRASVERISARLGVTKGAFYYHNRTKDELAAACFDRGFAAMWRAIRAAEAACDTGLGVLASTATALVELRLSGSTPLVRAAAITSAPEPLQAEVLARFDRVAERLAAIVSDGIADGSLRPVDANIAARMIAGLIDAAVELAFWTPGATPAEAARAFVRPLFAGLAAP